ncbi:FxsA family protein [Beggiatoa leptomitoformis]|uniref:Exlusion protein FxsA n=1 Tax=Beggiatoa leptomitoformis TaxID=288004 RepID=A0A2N9YIU4_9GAMM|nr:FxsA family protein [Beggiatoa leptomitoformis]ALG67387.1 hypothetical protein AL038_06320 [Beggiatoa leptomitoformis]AUI70403.1 hypothetical protein BLE401_17985 [Beggiatoa leptomitoformis]
MLKPQHLLLLFIIIPIVEIYLLVTVGQVIGILPTIFLVISMAVTGVYLLRVQGLVTLRKLRMTLAQGQEPTEPLLDGLFIMFGGILLLTPGFFTDFIALFCLIPLTRRLLIQYFVRHLQNTSYVTASYTVHTQQAAENPHKPTVIEGNFKREKDSEM